MAVFSCKTVFIRLHNG